MDLETRNPLRPRPTDNAVFRDAILGSQTEPTYGGVLSFMRRRFSRNLDGVEAVVLGIPFDAATSNRPGARFGPQAVRRASAILDGYPQYPFDADPFEDLAVIDYGDCSLDFGRVSEVPAALEAQARAIVQAGPLLISLGGDHFCTGPLLKVHAEKYGPLALVQFDAHQDTWTPSEGRIDHGSFVARAVNDGHILADRSIQIGIRTHAPADYGVKVLFGEDVEAMGVDGVVRAILESVGDAPAYITFDIDCLDPAFAPGTGTPVSGGLSSREALMILRRLGPLRIVGADLMEVSPPYDHADVTAIAGSTIMQYYFGLLAEQKAAGRRLG